MPRRAVPYVILVVYATVAAASRSDAQSVGFPDLPATPYDYVTYAVDNLPAHFGDGGFLSATSGDNTPEDNPITNHGATLGRVLFYDKRLSHNNSTSCASCHQQENGFDDASRFSLGFQGERTDRHSMSLTNVKFYKNNRFFRDESALSLESQVLQPIRDPIELGSNFGELIPELASTDYYPELFAAAFGSAEVTEEGISKAIAQFVRSMVSYQSKYDAAFDVRGKPRFGEVLNEQENLGRRLFHGVGRCSFCHTSDAHVAIQAHNNGLDAAAMDDGAGSGKFKTASLRNVATRDFFMHDGRFNTLEQVVEFYDNGIQDNPNLDFRLRDSNHNNAPIRFNFTDEEKAALVAFLETLTDELFITDPKFSDPFVLPCDFDHDEICDIHDLNHLLATGSVVHGVEVTSETERFDLDGSLSIDNDDVLTWLSIAAEANGQPSSYQRGDANLDGTVDTQDLALWQASLFQPTSDWNRGDWNGDGLADASDFNIWNDASADSTGEASTVPEPNKCWPIVLAGLVMAAIARILPA